MTANQHHRPGRKDKKNYPRCPRPADGDGWRPRAWPLALLLSLTLLLALAAGRAQAEDERAIRVGGGGASITTSFMPIASNFRNSTGILIIFLPSNPFRGLVSLDAGGLDIATGLLPLDNLREEAKREGKDIDFGQIKQFVLAKSSIVVFTDPANPVKALSRTQLQGIFSGRITNWKEVGGEDQELVVVWGKNTPGINFLFTQAIMDGQPVLHNREDAYSYTDIRFKVHNIPGAIGIDAVGFKDQSVQAPAVPNIECTIYAFVKGEPNPTVQQLLDYLLHKKSAGKP